MTHLPKCDKQRRRHIIRKYAQSMLKSINFKFLSNLHEMVAMCSTTMFFLCVNVHCFNICLFRSFAFLFLFIYLNFPYSGPLFIFTYRFRFVFPKSVSFQTFTQYFIRDSSSVHFAFPVGLTRCGSVYFFIVVVFYLFILFFG